MLDVTIMRNDQHLDTCYKQKLEYYDMSEITKWVGETTGCRFIHFAVERYDESDECGFSVSTQVQVL